MDNLNFPKFEFSTKIKENKSYIFDPIRKKWLVLTSEEWVRQHCIQYFIKTKNIPLGLIQVEKKLSVNLNPKRYDIVLASNTNFRPKGTTPYLLARLLLKKKKK